ncbi:unnamed protein product [Protopolystoma xenopodis]|uniref:Uncharacterized protein n=1 Tax=Protopolystoma xenopodis TaxID=117903 RepID=A0A448WUT6_9PLAT|nr:unnamed protein product [Protopolystoma xenopodis]
MLTLYFGSLASRTSSSCLNAENVTLSCVETVVETADSLDNSGRLCDVVKVNSCQGMPVSSALARYSRRSLQGRHASGTIVRLSLSLSECMSADESAHRLFS